MITKEMWKIFIEDMYPNKKERREVTKIIRISITGNVVGPDLYSIMEILGYDTVKKRILDFYYHKHI